MNTFGFVRLTASTLCCSVANPVANAAAIRGVLDQVADSDIVLFPELCMTGYTCADLFGQQALLDAAVEQTLRLAAAPAGDSSWWWSDCPSPSKTACITRRPSCATDRCSESFRSNTFRTTRSSTRAAGSPRRGVPSGRRSILADGETPFGIDLLFDAGPVVVGVEICEDLWVPTPPSSFQALAGANVLLNLSASNETIGKNKYRTGLVVGQSGRCIAAYAYASSGPDRVDDRPGLRRTLPDRGERSLLAESPRVGDGSPVRRDSYWITADVDVEHLQNDRRTAISFDECVPAVPRTYRRIAFALRPEMEGLRRSVAARPFVPNEDVELERRCAEIFGVQCAALAKRVEQLPADVPLNIGISGGLDSTLSLLVAVKMCDMLELPRSRIHGLTMPGFGTSERTRTNALDLMEHLGFTRDLIDIRPLCLDTFRAIDYRPFGINPAGRERRGFPAHADPHSRRKMPRPGVRERAGAVADAVADEPGIRDRDGRPFGAGARLVDVQCRSHVDVQPELLDPQNARPLSGPTCRRTRVRRRRAEDAALDRRKLISPELLPLGADGKSQQSTEESLGRFELHDFFLYHFVRNGFSPEKILFLSRFAAFTTALRRPRSKSRSARFTGDSSRTSSNARACPTAQKSARSVFRRAATGGCRATPTLACGSRSRAARRTLDRAFQRPPRSPRMRSFRR